MVKNETFRESNRVADKGEGANAVVVDSSLHQNGHNIPDLVIVIANELYIYFRDRFNGVVGSKSMGTIEIAFRFIQAGTS